MQLINLDPFTCFSRLILCSLPTLLLIILVGCLLQPEVEACGGKGGKGDWGGKGDKGDKGGKGGKGVKAVQGGPGDWASRGNRGAWGGRGGWRR